jgi:hypothetical protein
LDGCGSKRDEDAKTDGMQARTMDHKDKLRQVGIFLSGQKSTNQCTGALPAFHQQRQWTDKRVLQVLAAGAAFGNDLNSTHCILAIWTKPSKN